MSSRTYRTPRATERDRRRRQTDAMHESRRRIAAAQRVEAERLLLRIERVMRDCNVRSQGSAIRLHLIFGSEKATWRRASEKQLVAEVNRIRQQLARVARRVR